VTDKKEDNLPIITTDALCEEIAIFYFKLQNHEITDNKKCARRLRYLVEKIQLNERRKHGNMSDND
jgi:hypothetical protein